MHVSERRLRADLEANAQFGALDVEGHGRTVLTGSEANRRARERFVDRLEEAGLAVRVDAVGNIEGRWVPPDADSGLAPVAMGSHLDSVPVGGIFDGPLGTYGALEAVRALQQSDRSFTRPIHVVCFTEEEGQRFGNGLLGSSVATGRTQAEEALAYEDDDGRSLAQALRDIGFRGEERVNAADWDAWLELHVEQGTTLETTGASAGIVSSISGITHCYVDVTGEADHAGSTPMNERRDALAAASELVLEVESSALSIVEHESSSAVGTVGKAMAEPNATNVIPGTVRLGVDIRDVDSTSIERLVSQLQSAGDRIAAERGVDVSITRPYDIPPEPMAARCRDALADAGEAAGIRTLDMHSGAAHDTMNVARVTDAGLLFAPSRDGLSHNPGEWTDWDQCARATTVLAEGVSRLACR